MKNQKIFNYGIAATLSITSAYPVKAMEKENKPNIIIIYTDDLGYGDLSCYGNPVIRTPHLDKLASEGIRLTSFYVAASTSTPSRASLLTGRYPVRAGLPHVIFPNEDRGLSKEEVTIAEALKDLSYKTMCVGKWHLGQTRDEFLPINHGFDHYYGLITSNDMMKPWVQTDIPLHLYRDNEPTDEYPVDQSTLTVRYTHEACRFIAESKNEPFFLYLAHNMPHVPLYVSEKSKGRSLAGLYGDVIEEIDESVGAILQTLKEHHLEKNTIIIFASDNGPWINMPERMFKENRVKPWHAGSPGLLREGKTTSYEGGFRVPGILRWPEKIPPSQVSSQVVTNMDLFPTLIRAAGGEIPADRIIDGEDVMPILVGNKGYQRENDFFYIQGTRLEAIRSSEWKLRVSPYRGYGKPVNDKLLPELFNLSLDPSEQYNRANEFPDLVDSLLQKMKDLTIPGLDKKFIH